jgi:hypothetical protein
MGPPQLASSDGLLPVLAVRAASTGRSAFSYSIIIIIIIIVVVVDVIIIVVVVIIIIIIVRGGQPVAAPLFNEY